jgi:hypothetical protein
MSLIVLSQKSKARHNDVVKPAADNCLVLSSFQGNSLSDVLIAEKYRISACRITGCGNDLHELSNNSVKRQIFAGKVLSACCSGRYMVFTKNIW